MPVVERLRTAWGNESFTADIGFLDEMVRRVLQSDGPILDCGSGLSTVILAALTSPHEHTVISLEQDDHWYCEMRERLSTLMLDNVWLHCAPLVTSGEMVWYNIDNVVETTSGSHAVAINDPMSAMSGQSA